VERRFTWPPVVDRLLRLGEVSGSPVAPVALPGALVPVAADGPWREPDVAVAG
jgi:hypothetical protein